MSWATATTTRIIQRRSARTAERPCVSREPGEAVGWAMWPPGERSSSAYRYRGLEHRQLNRAAEIGQLTSSLVVPSIGAPEHSTKPQACDPAGKEELAGDTLRP